MGEKTFGPTVKTLQLSLLTFLFSDSKRKRSLTLMQLLLIQKNKEVENDKVENDKKETFFFIFLSCM